MKRTTLFVSSPKQFRPLETVFSVLPVRSRKFPCDVKFMVGESIVVIGDRDTVTGFKIVGVNESCVPRSPEDARQHLLEYFRHPSTGLILITERIAKKIEDTILELSQAPVPVIILIPDRDGPTGAHDEVMKELVRRAVGIEISI